MKVTSNIIQDKILMHAESSTFSVAKICIKGSLYHQHLSPISFKVYFKCNVPESRKVTTISIRGMSVGLWLCHGGSSAREAEEKKMVT